MKLYAQPVSGPEWGWVILADVVRIRAMGTFSVDVNGVPHEDLAVRSRKGVTLLLYLILENGKPVSTQRLIREIWAGRHSDAPENALKTRVSRARAMLNELSEGLGACIVSTGGGYRWQSGGNVTVDALEVMALCERLRGECSEADRVSLTERLLDIYQGDLFSTGEIRNDSILINYLHREYLDAVFRYIAQLRQAESFNRICEVCRRAMLVDGLDEQLHIELLQSMASLNRTGEAMTEYRRLARNVQNELGEEPSEEMRAVYDRLAQAGSALSYNLDVIRNELKETVSDRRGPFFCDYATFKEIYNIELRNLERMGSSIFLAMFMLGDPGDRMSPISRESGMAGLQEIMRVNLRKGDIITRFADNIYALLLPTVSYSTCAMVIERIEQLFYQEYPAGNITFHARFSPMGGE